MSYPPVHNFARLTSWSETNTLSRIKHDFPESPRVVNIAAELDRDKKVGDADIIYIKVYESRDSDGEESFGKLSFPHRDQLRFMAASIRLAGHEYDQFLAFMRWYGMEQPGSICFQVSVFEDGVPEEMLLDGNWEGKPFLKIVDFQYRFEITTTLNSDTERDD